MNVYFLLRDLLSRPTASPWIRALLAPLTVAGWAVGAGAGLRRGGYRAGVLRGSRAAVPVISVGNVTMGGTGKTPCVEAVCRILLGEGIRPAVLARGYGGTISGTWAAVSDGRKVLLPAEAAGDEPVLLAHRLPGAVVLVGRDRRVTAREAVSRFGAQVLVLDDGFQHHRLRRDLDIVAVDATNPWGNGHCLPRGLLREPLTSLRDAGIVVLTRTTRVEARRVDAIERSLRRAGVRAPVLRSGHEPTAVVDLADGAVLSLDELSGLKALAFAGIANPASFFQDLQRLGARVVESVPFPDHHRFSKADMDKLLEWTRLTNAEVLLTTEKDAMRLLPFAPLPIRSLALRIKLRIDDEDLFRRKILEVAVRPRG